jgi:hypothetical protein
MQIIRPYGQSRTSNQVRELVDKEKKPHDIADFAEQHAELIIAHWVSVIDKIARKPKQGKVGKQTGKTKDAGPTLVQYDLREKLGIAAWAVIKTKLPQDSNRQPYFDALWRFKIHPYGATRPTQQPAPNPTTPSRAPPEIKGRWYQRFVGDIEPQNVTSQAATTVIEQIRQHLDHNELRLGDNTNQHRIGKIPAQAKSISGNVLKQHRHESIWTPSDKDEYKANDVAAAIYDTASNLVNPQFSAKSHKIQLGHAGKCLFEHWAKVFVTAEGSVMNIAQAQQDKPGLLALHQAVKDGYSRMLKHTKKTDAALLATLPKTMAQLYQLIDYQAQNRDLASLVQLGKVLYYCDDVDKATALEKSRFWGSDGQAEIKRAEAFVRVWRHVIGQANLTLANWASMQQTFNGDILGTIKSLGLVTDQNNFDAVKFDQNVALIFGNDADLFAIDDTQRKATLQSAIKGMIDLRNAAFHFKARSMFLKALEEKLPSSASSTTGIANLWRAAAEKRTQRLIATIEGAHALHYFTQAEVQQLINALSADNRSHLPLPRFSRVLERHGNIQSNRHTSSLPPTANRNDLEQNPAQKCQYITLKLVYERAFRPWLESVSTTQLQEWITAALKRTTDAAVNMNAKGDADKKLLITARAEQLPLPQAGEDIRQFFFNLSAATASEMRVQRGYESDATAAQAQAEYIDELLCDVVALAFQAYLSQHQFSWLLALQPNTPLPEAPRCAIDKISLPATNIAAHANNEAWQQVLYFLLHLMPVGEVSQLLHQLAKWEITAGRVQSIDATEKERLDALQYTLKLYLDMHDSQYTSTEADGKSMPKIERDMLNDFIDFYENKAAFDLAFPEQGDGGAAAQYLPQRGLREIRRFGHIPVLKALVGQHKVSKATVHDCLNAEKSLAGKTLSPVAEAQQRREDLHKKWAQLRNKRDFTDSEAKHYCEALKQIIKHRHAANQSRLVDHVAAHRIVMKVLARLVDFSGLYERDLTFVTLALLHEHGIKAEDFFNKDGMGLFKNGQIFAALDNCNATLAGAKPVLDELTQHLGAQHKGSPNRKSRNKLAHFNMLQSSGESSKVEVNLTDWINQTRELMAYDRKLKNAVTKAVQELLAREGFTLTWKMGSDHKLSDAKLSALSASHLGNKKLSLKASGEGSISITECLHSEQLVTILANTFGGKSSPNIDVSTLNINLIDWHQPPVKHKQNGHTNAPTRPSRPK